MKRRRGRPELKGKGAATARRARPQHACAARRRRPGNPPRPADVSRDSRGALRVPSSPRRGHRWLRFPPGLLACSGRGRRAGLPVLPRPPARGVFSGQRAHPGLGFRAMPPPLPPGVAAPRGAPARRADDVTRLRSFLPHPVAMPPRSRVGQRAGKAQPTPRPAPPNARLALGLRGAR